MLNGLTQGYSFKVSLFYVYDVKAISTEKKNIIVDLATLKKLFQIAYSWPHDEIYISSNLCITCILFYVRSLQIYFHLICNATLQRKLFKFSYLLTKVWTLIKGRANNFWKMTLCLLLFYIYAKTNTVESS